MIEPRAHFVPWSRPSPLFDAIGGFQQHEHDPLHFGFVVEGPKLNARGFLHAGVVASIGDAVIGHSLATRSDPTARLVTINLSCDLLASAHQGEWVDIVVAPTHAGRRLGSGMATFSTERTVARVTGLFVPT